MAAEGGNNIRALVVSTATVLVMGGALYYQFAGRHSSSSGTGEAGRAAEEKVASADNFQKMEAEAQQKPDIGDDLATRTIKKYANKAGEAVGKVIEVPEPTPTVAPTPTPSVTPTAEPVAVAKVEEMKPATVECTAQDRAMDRPWCKKSEPARPSGRPSAPSVAVDAPPPSTGKIHPLLVAKELSREKLDVLKGRDTIYNDRVVRAGCRVWAVAEDAMIITPDRKHSLTVNVRGPLDGCTLPNVDGIRLVGKAEMDQSGKYFMAEISTCSDRSPKRKSVKCKGQVKSITGEDLLEGDLYDNSGWGIFWDSVLSIGMTPAIAKLTETAASAKTIFQATASASINDTLTKALNRVSEKIYGVFNDKEIRTKEGIIVIVMFPEDVIL